MCLIIDGGYLHSVHRKQSSGHAILLYCYNVTSFLTSLKQSGLPYESAETEKKHIRRAQRGLQSSMDYLCKTVYWTVIEQTNKLAGSQTSDDDFDNLLAAGVLAVVESVHRYSLDSKARLRTFAIPRIRGTIMREMSKEYSILSVPHNAVVEARKLTDGKTAGELNLTDIKAFCLVQASLPATRLDASTSDPANLLPPEPENPTIYVEGLDPEHMFVLCLSWGICGYAKLTRTEVAETLGYSQRKVATLLEEAVVMVAETMVD